MPKLPLPDAFLEFLRENGLDPLIYTAADSIPRYIRLKEGSEADLEEIEAEVECKLEKVVWLDGFYGLPPYIKITKSRAYREGKLYGMDAASGAAVSAMNLSVGDHVLDLCAAPGAKLCMILDILGNSGSVTGVDVARHRLAACRTLVQKYAIGDRCRLFVADGTTFSLVPTRPQLNSGSISQSERNDESALEQRSETFREWTFRRPWKERKRAAKVMASADSELVPRNEHPELIFYGRHSGIVGLSRSELYRSVCNGEVSLSGYDKVLVDAECTHDGSIRHVQKFENWGWATLQRRVLDADRTDSLTNLQLKLLTNGFRLLKVGGSLVYSTCSLTVAQNEDVVEQFLKENAFAELQEIDAAKDWPFRSGRIPKTLRFDPLTSRTSGLFVAKFTKLGI
ncbi:uncharacterized protein LOC116115600 isoform X2 [Pistacia vera]|uniref:uncharacterized protein LOC116115600 isoform X1 n=1 Tax=Pistacia vera TaxID=55513 RepID=UPI0012631C8F|nr:uncharacterized protein LOC116115600 isoform X1 [Pistacia vera]XP_031257594.1 uncharacterized protein LOC116115600 isoform X2 [Pistacia vera]